MHFWRRWLFVALRGLSLVALRGLLLGVVRGLLIAVASLVADVASRCTGFSSCGAQAQ